MNLLPIKEGPLKAQTLSLLLRRAGLARAGQILGLALAYYVGGQIGRWLAVPPGFTAALWPPAGIALAALLLWGSRCWPGVWLGSFVVNLVIAFETNADTAPGSAAITAGAIAAGAALQAWVGARLLRRALEKPFALERPREIGLLLVLGSASCSINAAAGPTILYLSGAIPVQALAFNVFTWWVGDALGVVALTPLLLLIAASPPALGRTRQWVMSVTTAAGLTLVATAFYAVLAYDAAQRQRAFTDQATEIVQDLQQELNGYLTVLLANGQLIVASKQVDFTEFVAFTAPFFQNYPGLYSLSWNPAVSGAERAEFERFIRAQGFADFVIRDRSEPGTLTPAPPRERYFPVGYVVPYQRNRAAHGFDTYGPDPLGGGARVRALDHARDQDRAIGTGRISVVQAEQAYGLLVYHPVFAAPSTAGADGAPRTLRGYAAGVFIFSEMVAASARRAARHGMDLLLSDLDAPPDTRLLYDSRTPDHREGGPAPAAAALTARQTVDFAGRRWQMRFIGRGPATGAGRSWALWALLIGGFCLSGLGSALLLIVTGRAAAIERQAEAKALALKHSEARLGTILDNTADGVIIADERGQIEALNPAAEALFGRRTQDALGQPLSALLPALGSSPALGLSPAAGAGPVRELTGMRPDGNAFPAEVSLCVAAVGRRRITSAIVRDVTERHKEERFINQIYTVTSRADTSVEHKLQAVLALGLEYFDLALGIVSEIRGPGYLVRYVYPAGSIDPGQRFELAGTYCAHVVAQDTVKAWHRAGESEISHHPCYRTFGLESYIGAPITVSGARYGTLNFSAATARTRPFTEREKAFIKLIAQWVGEELTRAAALRALETAKDELTRSNTELDSFAYAAAHDLKAPLRGIDNASSWLAEDLADRLDDDDRKHMALLRGRVRRMEALLDDLLEYARAGRADSTDNQGTVRGSKLLEDITALLAPAADVTITADAAFAALPCERMPLQRVLYNLIGNAIKHREGRAISVEVSAQRGERYHRISVKDNGPGIAEAYHEQIFKMFKTLRPRDQVEGSGMGLALVKKLVETRGGTITVNSAPDQGCAFCFTWPSVGERRRRDGAHR